jgi:hypothetical protein
LIKPLNVKVFKQPVPEETIQLRLIDDETFGPTVVTVDKDGETLWTLISFRPNYEGQLYAVTHMGIDSELIAANGDGTIQVETY